jgi:hypothetical protein
MSAENYWIGANTSFRSIWEDFDNGSAYITKFRSSTVHMIKFKFRAYSSRDPLYNHEAIYKTLKAYFHDVKKACFTEQQYIESPPVFLYEIRRGSEEFSFLGELPQLLLVGTTLSAEKALGQVIENYDKKLDFIKKHFPDSIGSQEFFRFMEANQPEAIDHAVKKLLEQHLVKISVSKKPFIGERPKSWVTLPRKNSE